LGSPTSFFPPSDARVFRARSHTALALAPALPPTPRYAADLCDIVERNAENEFGLIWDEMQRTGTHATELTDVISSSMNDLNDKIGASSLFENDAMRRRVLTNHFPKTLVASEGYESICERVPVNYQKAIFSMGVAAEFVYAHGPFADSFKFYEFMTELERES